MFNNAISNSQVFDNLRLVNHNFIKNILEKDNKEEMIRKQLPNKEAELFREIVNCYENKKFHKGLKYANELLQKFPEHGETEAMKGLLYNCLDKKTEAYDYIKRGLRHDLKSYICWHVFGLIQKSDGNYKEAIKAYMNALKFDSNNLNILKDISSLYIHIKDYQNNLIIRDKILELRPLSKQSWIGYSIAMYFIQNYKVAYDTITKYFENILDKGNQYEESEIILYQNNILAKLGKYQLCIDHFHLNIKKSLITDILYTRIKIAEYLLLLGKYNESKEIYIELIYEQSENYKYHIGLQLTLLELNKKKCLELLQLEKLYLPCLVLNMNINESKKLLDFYQNILQCHNTKSKKSKCIQMIILYLSYQYDINGIFLSLLDEYLRKSIHLGIPSLYQDITSFLYIINPKNTCQMIFIKDIYQIRQHKVIQVVLDLVNTYINNLKLYHSFDNPNDNDNDTGLKIKLTLASPSALLWALFLKCHLLEISGYYFEALQVINECIEHTPTALDMYLKKARILKDLGQLSYASSIMDSCRQLDLQDRFLNNKTTKYLLRANRINEAMTTIALFTKHDGDPQMILYDLQVNWYSLEIAEAYIRQLLIGPALKKFYAILKHFIDYYDDIYDFHSYCMRKTTLRMYCHMIDSQDKLFTHKFFQRAYCGVIKIFLDILNGFIHIETNTNSNEVKDIKDTNTSTNTSNQEMTSSSSSAMVIADDEEEDDKELEEESKPKVDNDPNGDSYLQRDFKAELASWSSHLESRLSHCDASTIKMYCLAMIQLNRLHETYQALKISMNLSKEDDVNLFSLLIKTKENMNFDFLFIGMKLLCSIALMSSTPTDKLTPTDRQNQEYLEKYVIEVIGNHLDIESYFIQIINQFDHNNMELTFSQLMTILKIWQCIHEYYVKEDIKDNTNSLNNGIGNGIGNGNDIGNGNGNGKYIGNGNGNTDGTNTNTNTNTTNSKYLSHGIELFHQYQQNNKLFELKGITNTTMIQCFEILQRFYSSFNIFQEFYDSVKLKFPYFDCVKDEKELEDAKQEGYLKILLDRDS